jgi:hypothetical protein
MCVHLYMLSYGIFFFACRKKYSKIVLLYISIKSWTVESSDYLYRYELNCKQKNFKSFSFKIVYTSLLESPYNELQRTLVHSAHRKNCVNAENLRSSSSPTPLRGLGESPVPASNVVSQSFFLVYLRLVFRMVDIYMLVVECGYVPFFADVLSIYSCII